MMYGWQMGFISHPKMPIRIYDIHILGMKSKKIPKEVADFGEFIRQMIKDNVFPGMKGGGSHYHAEAVIPNQVEFICDTCEKTLHKGEWFCQRHRDGNLWCRKCWKKSEDKKKTGIKGKRKKSNRKLEKIRKRRDGGEVKPARLKTLSVKSETKNDTQDSLDS